MPRRLLDRIVRRLELPDDREARAAKLLDTEWLVTNGIGGYSSSSMAGVITRRYHGLLVAALPNPLGRTVMLNHLGERVVVNGETTPLNSEERVAGRVDPDVSARVAGIRLDAGLPVWEFRYGDVRIEKRVMMPHGQNTVHLTYRLLEGPAQAELELRPAVHFRGYEDHVGVARNSPSTCRYVMSQEGGVHLLSVEASQRTPEATSGSPSTPSAVAGAIPGASAPDSSALPPLRIKIASQLPAEFMDDEHVTSEFLYPVEESRGYEFRGTLWTPGVFKVALMRDACVTFIASVEPSDVMLALSPDEVARCEQERRRRLAFASVTQAQGDEAGGELVLAADQFIITPVGRIADATRAKALGHEVRTVIAGYHWFTDWGRDTMISLEGLTLTTGRQHEAEFILRTFAHYVCDGLIPNMFPDGSNQGLYNTADATLWFFHAIEAYVRRTGDQVTLMHLLPTLINIVDHHVTGTRFGIGVDPADGLLRQGAEGYQLTWMDAKVNGWVVTPRRGKAVEINALWYNALRLLQGWLTQLRGADAAEAIKQRADGVYEVFNERFWMPDRGYLYDVLDGDPAEAALCRPNQIFSISLNHPVLDRSCWAPVMQVIQDRLLTPVGLRSLAPGEPEYKKRYFGDLRSRDAAYHQGTVWAWLIGPWIDAWIKLHPEDRAGARRFLSGCIAALDEFGLGTIGEIFDAEPPYTPRGCIAQAWSVAEVLRCWVKTAADDTPSSPDRIMA